MSCRLTSILKVAWKAAQESSDKKEKLQALSLAKDCYEMKLELSTHSTVVDDAMRFISVHRMQEKRTEGAETELFPKLNVLMNISIISYNMTL